jgi:hypothetical protein
MANVPVNPDIPPELVTEIAKFCDPVTCAKAIQVSGLWRDIFTEQFFVYNGDINGQNIESISEGIDLSRIISITGNLIDCDVNHFPNLRSITGNIQCLQDIVTLDNFQNLTTVGGWMTFYGCTGLTSVNGLRNLTTVGGHLNFYGCTGLSSVDGLSILTTVGRYLSFYGCTGLTSVDGLQNLTAVGGYLDFYGCTGLTSVDGLQNLITVGENLDFRGCTGLSSVDGLRNLTTVGGNLLK